MKGSRIDRGGARDAEVTTRGDKGFTGQPRVIMDYGKYAGKTHSTMSSYAVYFLFFGSSIC